MAAGRMVGSGSAFSLGARGGGGGGGGGEGGVAERSDDRGVERRGNQDMGRTEGK